MTLKEYLLQHKMKSVDVENILTVFMLQVIQLNRLKESPDYGKKVDEIISLTASTLTRNANNQVMNILQLIDNVDNSILKRQKR